MNVCFCTLAIHAPYRRRARRLIGDMCGVPWVVLTDEPDNFEGLAVRAVRHVAVGPMARDFLVNPALAGNTTGLPAYHDKRFVLQEALKDFDTAIFMDADTRLRSLPRLPQFRPGIAVTKVLRGSIAEHLSRWGSERRPVFEQLALHLGGGVEMLERVRWFNEALFAVTKDGNENRFFEAWGRAAEFLQSKGVFTGEGGVIGLAAAYAGWTVDYDSLDKLAASSTHEGRGPKGE
ncbi:MAG TPA: hypothetical protein VF088_21495 [Pyrinomonadaceae bacterium]